MERSQCLLVAQPRLRRCEKDAFVLGRGKLATELNLLNLIDEYMTALLVRRMSVKCRERGRNNTSRPGPL